MPFDPTFPSTGAALRAADFRDQFNAVHAEASMPETDPVFAASPAAQFVAGDKAKLDTALQAVPGLTAVLQASNNAGGNSLTNVAAVNFTGSLLISAVSSVMRLDSNVPLALRAEHGPTIGLGAAGLDCAGSVIANVQAPGADSDADTQGARNAALAGLSVLAAPVTVPALVNSQLGFSLDEAGNNLVITVQYSTGTVKSVTLPLVPGAHDGVDGLELVDKVVRIDQSPIGRTPRSNPATYTGLFTVIRDLFATVPEARARGYTAGRFSFNVKGGRCEACAGEGYNQIEMQFLPDVTVPCEVCHGQRYNREALEITFRGSHIAEVLNMTVSTALEFFEAFPAARRKLQTLHDVGLGYIRLGQPATTMSGGEAQRVKLSTELSRRSTGRTVYILDEPTTGLSFGDTEALLRVLQALVDGGNTVIVIEHNLDVIKNADWLIDLGPAGGQRGGYLLAEGTPEQLATIEASATGRFLQGMLGSGSKRAPAPVRAPARPRRTLAKAR